MVSLLRKCFEPIDNEAWAESGYTCGAYMALIDEKLSTEPARPPSITDTRPGLNPNRLVRLMKEAVHRCELDLKGVTVLTEAASGSYIVTPIMAAMAGASRVFAVTRSNRFGTAQQKAADTEVLAELAGQGRRIEYISEISREVVSQADIVTNSGSVRPITAEFVSWMKPDAVIPLMYETWEFRPADLDIEACHQRGIALAGTNERHPAIGVFSFLGMMAVKQLFDAGIGVYQSRVLLLCNNPFLPYMESALQCCGAYVRSADSTGGALGSERFDAVIVAMTPQPGPVLSIDDMRRIAEHSPGVVLLQYWGDIDRAEAAEAGLSVCPADAPPAGHMGILPAEIGPEPTVRLQSGGLKAGEVLYRRSYETSPAAAEFIQKVAVYEAGNL
jgi:hypothetical protein